MVPRLLCLTLEVTLGSRDILLAEVVSFLIIAAIADRDSATLGRRFCTFLPHLAPFLTLLMVALDGGARLPPAAAFTLPRTKVSLAASLPEACRAAISSSSLVVLANHS
jgi:hypothetical protein